MILSPRHSSAQAFLGIVTSCVLKRKISQNLNNVYKFLKPSSFDILDMKMKILGSSNLNMIFQFNLREKRLFLASHSANIQKFCQTNKKSFLCKTITLFCYIIRLLHQHHHTSYLVSQRALTEH